MFLQNNLEKNMHNNIKNTISEATKKRGRGEITIKDPKKDRQNQQMGIIVEDNQ